MPCGFAPSAAVLLCCAARRTDCPVASLLAMTCCNMHLPAWQGHFPSGKFVALSVFLRHHPPCNRAHLPVFSMSLRASAHTGVAIRVPAEILDKLAAVGANSQHLSYSPKVFPFAMCCRKENGLPRRSAPRNDMQKHAGVHMAMTWYHGKFVTFFVFAQSTAPHHPLPQGMRIVPSLRSSQ